MYIPSRALLSCCIDRQGNSLCFSCYIWCNHH